jgi:hypothetical protein
MKLNESRRIDEPAIFYLSSRHLRHVIVFISRQFSPRVVAATSVPPPRATFASTFAFDF